MLLIQGIDRELVLPTRTDCARKSCRVGLAKNENSIPETEVRHIHENILYYIKEHSILFDMFVYNSNIYGLLLQFTCDRNQFPASLGSNLIGVDGYIQGKKFRLMRTTISKVRL